MNAFKRVNKRLTSALTILLVSAGLAGCTISSADAQTCGQQSNSTTTPQVTVDPNASLEQAIKAYAQGNNRLVAGMLFGSYMESSRRNDATDGMAFGPYQIQEPGVIHPDITVAQAEDPVYATGYMLGTYQNALNTFDPRLWVTDPQSAMEQTAFNAEHPTVTYHVSQGYAKVHAGYLDTLATMARDGVSTIFSSSAPSESTASVTAVSIKCNPYQGDGTGKRGKVLQAAESQLGVMYVWAAEQPRTSTNAGAFDCSGLVQYALGQGDVDIGAQHLAADQWDKTKQFQVQLGKEQPGDLVFFIGDDGTAEKPGHVGIVVDPEKGIMINAPQTGKPVEYDNYKNWGGLVGITDPYQMAA